MALHKVKPEEIKAAIRRKGMSQTSLAIAAGVSRNRIIQLLHVQKDGKGESGTLATIQAVAIALDLSLKKMLDQTDPNNTDLLGTRYFGSDGVLQALADWEKLHGGESELLIDMLDVGPGKSWGAIFKGALPRTSSKKIWLFAE